MARWCLNICAQFICNSIEWDLTSLCVSFISTKFNPLLNAATGTVDSSSGCMQKGVKLCETSSTVFDA